MTADEFVEIVRNGSEKLRVDEIVVSTGSQELHGRGMLHISRDRIEIQVTINPGEHLPELAPGIYTKKDTWKLAGLIEDQLQFKCEHVRPTGKRQWLWPGSIEKCTFKLHPIDLVPTGWDAMSREQRKEFLKQQQVDDPQQRPEDGTENDFSFYATLLEYPLLATTWGTEVKGETESFEFVLRKKEENSDLRIILHSKKNIQFSSEQEHWIKFNAFMNALAFANGIHAWPYRIEYWREGQKITDRITAAEKLGKTAHAPFTDRLAFNAQTGSLKWNFQEAIKKSADFFGEDSALSKEVSIILFLFREADEGVHSEITTIALCTLFENLVRLLFRELHLEDTAANENTKLFEEAKAEVLGQVSLQIAEKGAGYQRLHNLLQSAQSFSMEQMFRAITNHFGLKWQDDMENIFKTWKRARHPLVHDKTRAELPEDKIKGSAINESQIAGAINILLLKLFGYSGYMRHSAFEDGYRQI